MLQKIYQSFAEAFISHVSTHSSRVPGISFWFKFLKYIGPTRQPLSFLSTSMCACHHVLQRFLLRCLLWEAVVAPLPLATRSPHPPRTQVRRDPKGKHHCTPSSRVRNCRRSVMALPCHRGHCTCARNRQTRQDELQNPHPLSKPRAISFPLFTITTELAPSPPRRYTPPEPPPRVSMEAR
jgi:hypothetical protein